jgi:3-hydroxyacyl-[acyl-carrier-protein] dehydratase
MTDVKQYLPHRDPFLFVDRIEKADAEQIVGYRMFRETDDFFRGHFPGFPVVPGVILIESLAQCGGAGAKIATGIQGLFFLATVEKAKFRRQVKPGDEIRMEIRTLRVSKIMLRQAGKAFVGEELAVEAEWFCLIGEAPQP